MSKVNLLGILTCIIFSGCSKYQYRTLSSDLPAKIHNEFIRESDSLKITYRFSGPAGLIEIEVYNKIESPIFVDWKKSSLILNNERFPYWWDESVIKASSSSRRIQWTKLVSTTNGNLSGTISKNEQISFIPPKSSVKISPLIIANSFYKLPRASKDQLSEVNSINVKRYTFDEKNTPLKFRSFLGISTTENFLNPIYYDNVFWITEVKETELEPSTTDANQYYTSKITGGTNAVIAIILTGLVALFIAAKLQ